MYELHLNDHEGFQKTVLRSTLVAAGLAMAMQWLTWVTRGAGEWIPALWLAFGVGAALVAVRTGLSAGLPRLLGLSGAVSGLATLAAWALVSRGHHYLAAAAFGAVLGAGTLWGGAAGASTSSRRLWTPLATGLAGVLGLYVATGLTIALVAAAPTTPIWLAVGFFAALGAFFLSLGELGHRVTLSRDPVTSAFRAIQPKVGGELRGLAERALRTRRDIHDAIRVTQAEPDGPARVPAELGHNVDDVLLRVMGLASKCAELETEVARTPVAELTDRLERLDQKIEACHDAVAKEQYGQAKAALGAQLSYRQQIEAARERVVARLHNDLAELEKVRLALIRARSMDAGAAAEALAPLVERLKSVGEDLDVTSDAMGEAAETA